MFVRHRPSLSVHARPRRHQLPRVSLKCGADGGKQHAKLFFSVPKKVAFGYSVGLVGSAVAVGNWNPDKGLALTWHDNDCWTGEVTVPVGEQIEYKFFTRDEHGHVAEWQPGNNLLLDVPNAANAILLVTDDWNSKERVLSIQAEAKPAEGPPTAPQPPSIPESFPAPEEDPSLLRDKPHASQAPAKLQFQPPESSHGEAFKSSSPADDSAIGAPEAASAPAVAEESEVGASSNGAHPVEEEEPHAFASASGQTAGNGVPPIEELKSMKVKDLKGLLKKKGLPVAGRKAELIERLREG